VIQNPTCPWITLNP